MTVSDGDTGSGAPCSGEGDEDRVNHLRGLLESYVRCPTSVLLADVEAALRLYQTRWITARAGGVPNPGVPDPGKNTSDTGAPAAPSFESLPKLPRLPVADQTILERLADGWVPTAAEVTRWAWLEDRGLVRLDQGPPGSDRADKECLYLTPDGYRAIGRPMPMGGR